MSLEKSPWRTESLVTSESFEEASLRALAIELRTSSFPGYPKLHERLYMSDPATDSKGRPDLVDIGIWKVGQAFPTPDEYRVIHGSGMSTDSTGRPIHPWLRRMLVDPDIGIVTGKGVYYNWGPNYTADPIIMHGSDVLMIIRGDGSLAFPGGFLNTSEPARMAAVREAMEETGVIVPGTARSTLLYHGPVSDIRMTANAWPVTTAFLFELDTNLPRPIAIAGDDAEQAFWLPIEAVRQASLFGSHSMLMEIACQQRPHSY